MSTHGLGMGDPVRMQLGRAACMAAQAHGAGTALAPLASERATLDDLGLSVWWAPGITPSPTVCGLPNDGSVEAVLVRHGGLKPAEALVRMRGGGAQEAPQRSPLARANMERGLWPWAVGCGGVCVSFMDQDLDGSFGPAPKSTSCSWSEGRFLVFWRPRGSPGCQWSVGFEEGRRDLQRAVGNKVSPHTCTGTKERTAHARTGNADWPGTLISLLRVRSIGLLVLALLVGSPPVSCTCLCGRSPPAVGVMVTVHGAQVGPAWWAPTHPPRVVWRITHAR